MMFDCKRCSGSGEDPEGFYDQSHGADGGTHEGPCRKCNGSGRTPLDIPNCVMILFIIIMLVMNILAIIH